MSGLVMNMKQLKATGILIFGLLAPIAILIAAYLQLNQSTELIDADTSISEINGSFKAANRNLYSFNDYTLYSLMLVESNNLKSIINKQHMKNTVVHIGFATISLGLAFILLGIKEENGGGEVSMKYIGASFDMKTSSTGAYVFVIGALMATLGGALPNQYNGSGLPVYDRAEQHSKETRHLLRLGLDVAELKKQCDSQPVFERCVTERFNSLFVSVSS